MSNKQPISTFLGTGPLGHRLGAGLGPHRRFQLEATTGTWVFAGGALHSWSESSAVEPGEGQMGMSA